MSCDGVVRLRERITPHSGETKYCLCRLPGMRARASDTLIALRVRDCAANSQATFLPVAAEPDGQQLVESDGQPAAHEVAAPTRPELAGGAVLQKSKCHTRSLPTTLKFCPSLSATVDSDGQLLYPRRMNQRGGRSL